MTKFEQYIYLNEEVISKLVFICDPDIAPDTVEIHQEIYKWGPASFREMLKVWEDIKQHLKDAGAKQLVAAYPVAMANCPKKYWKLVGFPEAEKRECFLGEFWYSSIQL